MAKNSRPSNEAILQQLKEGTAHFELASSHVPIASLADASPRFFARIEPSLGVNSPVMRKVERYSVKKVTGDGRCLFRALVKGMALNKGMRLGPREETDNADELRMAVKEVICDDERERRRYKEALLAITIDEPLGRYCQRIARPDFWGGEAELLVLSKLCNQPILVYIPEHEHGGRGNGYIPIQEYGIEFSRGKAKSVVRLLYSGKNHYDLSSERFD